MKKTLQRIILGGLILTQAAAFGFMTGVYVYPMIIAGLVVVGMPGRFHTSLNGARELIMTLALALPFVALWRLLPDYGPDINGLLDAELTYVMGQYFLLLQAINLFLSREDSYPRRLVVFGVITFICAGNIYKAGGQYSVYRVSCLLFGLLATLFLVLTARKKEGVGRERSTEKNVLTVCLVILSLGIAIGTGHVMHKYRSKFDQMLFALLQNTGGSQTTGFSSEAKLGSVVRMKNDNSRQVSLRIFSSEKPGYMRGKAYSQFSRSEWENLARKRNLYPSVQYMPDVSHNVFVPGEVGPEPWRETKIWPVSGISEGMFTPLCTDAVGVATESVAVDEHDIYSSDTLIRGVPYTAYCTGVDSKSEGVPDKYLDLPSINDRVSELAGEIFADYQTTEQKIDAVVQYFQHNYSYALDIKIPEERDPLTYFLLEKPDAHCEYFASGTAILLRLAGVPTRYVAGYVAEERNNIGGYWVAREKDAHAWVEAYVPEEGWTTVESTPPAGQPQSGGHNKMSEMWDYIRYRMQELIASFHNHGLKGLVWWLMARGRAFVSALFSTTWLALMVKGFLLGVLVAYLFWRRLWLRRHACEGNTPKDRIQSLLRRMDSRMEEHGITRSETETIHQFVRRVRNEYDDDVDFTERIDRWYIRYAWVRYGEEVSPERVKELEDDMPEV